MKRIITLIICISLIEGTIYKFDYLTDKLISFLTDEPILIQEDGNSYHKDKNYNYVQIANKYIPYSFQELLNIFYTALDKGYEKVVFHCPDEYLTCAEDIDQISKKNNEHILTAVGNFVSPFNNFTSLSVEASKNTYGDVILTINHKYTKDEIERINSKIDQILNEIKTPNMTNEDLIKAFHDYIIENTTYDQNYEKELQEIKDGKRETTTYPSDKATGPLFYKNAICSGYTDVMALLLDRLKIDNFKIASKDHIWNAVKINNEWKHLDLTWDDPVNYETVLHKFYLIDTKTLEEYDIETHTFDKSIYIELK